MIPTEIFFEADSEDLLNERKDFERLSGCKYLDALSTRVRSLNI